LRALEKAMKYRFFDFNAFNLEEYEHFEQVENGDCNIILPGRFLALAGPLVNILLFDMQQYIICHMIDDIIV
jgi:hypothetical protein